MTRYKKTVYMVSECPYAGILKAMLENANFLLEMNFNIVFVFPENTRDRYGERLEKHVDDLKKIGEVEFISMTKKYSCILRDSRGLYNFLLSRKEDKIIVFSYGSYAGKIARVLYMFKKVDILCHVSQCIDLERMSFRYKFMELIMEKMLSSFASKYLACSPSEVYRLSEICGISLDKIIFSPNSVSLDLDLSNNQNRRYNYIYVGRLVKSKGIENILIALKNIGLLHELLVLGDGCEFERMKKEYPEVNFIGNIPNREVNDYLKMSRFIINNSCVEGLSFSLVEAMSCGVIPIVSDVDGNRDIVIDSYNGFTFKSRKELNDVLFKTRLMDKRKMSAMSFAASHVATQLNRIGRNNFFNLIELLSK